MCTGMSHIRPALSPNLESADFQPPTLRRRKKIESLLMISSRLIVAEKVMRCNIFFRNVDSSSLLRLKRKSKLGAL